MRHPLAVLRTTIGLTQKEMAQMIGRAPRTIQAIELGQLPLSEELALRIAAETGVDESWLLEGDASAPPERGPALLAFAGENRPYEKRDYEWQRAFNEATPVTEAELARAVREDFKVVGGHVSVTRAQAKAMVKAAEPVMLESRDERLMAAMQAFLKVTIRSRDALLVRWKLRGLLSQLAKERGIELPRMDLGTAKPAKGKRRGNIKISR
jgi:transcriptional regulator with XRE-family HTH domain